jgi:hypothetical protein
MHRRAAAIERAAILVALLIAGRAAAQNVGHKLLGTLGLDAGTQHDTGIYVGNRLFLFTASDVRDRNGNPLPGSFDLSAVADSIGIAGTYELPKLHTFVNASFGVPIARATLNSSNLQASFDRFGLADIYIEPLRLGWRVPHVDLVTGYAFYVPTGRFTTGGTGSVSSAQWSHEFSLGTTVYFDRNRTFQFSALASYLHNEKKLGIDLTRGDTVQVQGGAGFTHFHRFDLGLDGYGLWQVRDDSGSALPDVLRGARDRVYGVGAEVGVRVVAVRARVSFRYAHDLGAESRPQGQLVYVNLVFVPWSHRR